MKKQSIIVSLCAAAGILASSCSQETEQISKDNASKTYVATVENNGATRSYNAGNGAFVWSNGDDISAYTEKGFKTMTFKSGAGTGVATYESVTYIPQDVVVFPVSAAKSYDNNTLTVSYPETIAQSGNANDPMVALFGKGESTFNFKHVGGVIAFNIAMPAGANALVVTTDKVIAGDFTVATSGEAPVVTTSDKATGSKSVKFTFTKTTASGMMSFYLPVPTGTYDFIKLAAMNGSTLIKEVTNTSSNTINRCDWTTFEMNLCTNTATIEQTVTGVNAFNNLVGSKTAAELANMDLTLDLNNETLTKDNTNKKLAITTNSITIKNGTVDATGLNISASNTITLKDVKLTGAYPKATYGNARVSLNTPGKIVIDGVDFTNTTDGYNAIEINLGSNPITSNVEIKNCKFGPKLTNNSILIFGLTEGGTANIENCDFDLSAKSNGIRISNKFNAHTFTVNIKNCNFKYADTTTESFILFQDYTSGNAATTNKQFSGLKINCTNLTKNGTKVTEFGTTSASDMSNQIAYVYYNDYGVQTDLSHYPTFTFE